MASSDRDGDKEGESNLSYSTPWPANGLSWACSDTVPFRLAISSYIQDYKNYVDIVERDESGQLVCHASWEHCYPPTKTMFPPKQLSSDYIVTTADYLRLWEITPMTEEEKASGSQSQNHRPDAAGGRPSSPGSKSQQSSSINAKVTLKQVFDSSKPNDFCSPVTSCDWNSEDLNTVGCCSIDTTVTIWDLERGQQKTKLVAHDKDVYDMAFISAHTFASCGADGSVRVFDLRDMDHCTVLYETPGLSPMLRVASNQQDRNYISTFGIESPDAVVIDIRYPGVTASLLTDRHMQPINGMAWSPQSAQNISTVGEDGIVWIWSANADIGEPLYNHTCGVPINNVAWRHANQQDWIAITTSEGANLLRV